MTQFEAINPWRWQEAHGFSQAVRVDGARRQLFCAGQTAVDAQGVAQHPGDMAAQLELAFDNLERVLAAAGMTLANVARLNYYVTDLPAFFAASSVITRRLKDSTYKPAGTLLGVAALHDPQILVEVEATALD